MYIYTQYTLTIQGCFTVVIPYMHTVYFEQVHSLHYIPTPSSLLPLFCTVFRGFHYAVFKHTYSLFQPSSLPPQYSFFSPSLSHLSPPQIISLSHSCPIHHHHFRSRFHKWVRTCDIWLWGHGLSHSAWWAPVPFTFQQTQFYFLYDWVIFHSIYTHKCMYTYYILYFILSW
jgi:hypothetical protein